MFALIPKIQSLGGPHLMPGLFFSGPSPWWALNSNFCFHSPSRLLKAMLNFPSSHLTILLNWQMPWWCKQQNVRLTSLGFSSFWDLDVCGIFIIKKKNGCSSSSTTFAMWLCCSSQQKYSLLPHPLTLGWSYSLLWPIENSRSTSGTKASGGLHGSILSQTLALGIAMRTNTSYSAGICKTTWSREGLFHLGPS